jgi:hypothetical protein
MDATWIDELDGQQAADAVVSIQDRLVQTEVEQFVLAAHWADLHAPDAVTGVGAGGVLPGAERVKRYGGDGTPEAGEFAAAELAALLGCSMAAAASLMADSLDVRHRLPLLWRAVRATEVRVWKARHVARRTRAVGLSRDQALWVDAQTTPYAASLPWGRFLDLLEAKIVEVDPEAADARARAAALERFVRTGRCNEYGLKTIVAKATAGDAVFFIAMCDRIAQILVLEGDTDPVDVRRSKAIGILADPARALQMLMRHAAPDDTSAQPGPDDTSARCGPDDGPETTPGQPPPASDDELATPGRVTTGHARTWPLARRLPGRTSSGPR